MQHQFSENNFSSHRSFIVAAAGTHKYYFWLVEEHLGHTEQEKKGKCFVFLSYFLKDVPSSSQNGLENLKGESFGVRTEI